MKKILSLIFVYAMLIFTACAEESDTTATDTQTNGTEFAEERTEEVEMSDEEYLISLGKRLKLGMTEEEVVAEIGEPDQHGGSGRYWLEYYRGDCCLRVWTWIDPYEVYRVAVYNDKTGNNTEIYSIYDE